MNRGLLITVILCGLCMNQPGYTLTFYMNEYVTKTNNKLVAGDIISLQPVSETLLQGAALQELSFPAEKICLIPAAEVKACIAPFYPGTLVLVGQQTVVLPEKLETIYGRSLLTQLVKCIEPLKKERDYRLEISIVSPIPVNGSCTDITFTIMDDPQKRDLLTATRQITWSSPVQGSGNFDVYIEQYNVTPGGQLPGYKKVEWKEKEVKAGDTILIHFRKGGIDLKIDGMAYASGARGDMVAVKPSTTTKRFKALVIGHKEVTVEIP